MDIRTFTSPTRLKIISLLKEKKKTPSDIAKKTGKSPSTIIEHLQVLSKEGLIVKEELPGRKRVLYGLSREGQIMVAKNSIPLFYAGTILFAGGAILTAIDGFLGNFNLNAHGDEAELLTQAPQSAEMLVESLKSAADASQVSGDPLAILGPAFFLLGCLIFLYLKRLKPGKD